jgi:hypothetical protein
MVEKHNFHFTLKAFFGFAVFTEPDTGHIPPLAHTLGQAFSESVQALRYGKGVKHIAAGLILTDSEGLGRLHKVRRPKYSPGLRTIKAHGLTVSTEDTLEFDLRPLFADVRSARTESEVAAAILPAITHVKPALRKLKVADFDLGLFLGDFEGFLARVQKNGLTWNEMTTFHA